MPPSARMGCDLQVGHGSFPPILTATGSPNVFHNSCPSHRMGDIFIPHASPSPSPPHMGITVTGSPNVYHNSMLSARLLDIVLCTSVIITGSPNIFING